MISTKQLLYEGVYNIFKNQNDLYGLPLNQILGKKYNFNNFFLTQANELKSRRCKQSQIKIVNTKLIILINLG